jgi:RNase P protein component
MGEKEKLGKDSQFSAAYERSRTWANDFIVPKTLRNGVDGNRYGFVAGRRLGKAAIRN